MSIEQDIERIFLQEKRLQFESFDSSTAWEIGARLKAAAEQRAVSVAIDISFHNFPLFFYAMPGTTPGNHDWVRRKRNLVALMHRSSYAIGLSLERDKTTLDSKMGLPLRDYAPHGGSFPILLRNTGCVGAITVSGLPQRKDHELVVAVLASFLRIPLEEVSLDPPDSRK
ncbi:MAG TPA: heme-degrading domain-containing protein [Verrucomicrobiae bacterium]|nr:heme-degrading domain-containing protein [Verrucomicrobiae bacterium]